MIEILNLLKTDNFWIRTVIPITLTAALSYYFTIRRSSIEKEIFFSEKSAEEVEEIYFELIKLTEDFSIHIQDLIYQRSKNIDKQTIDLLIKTKNKIYQHYFKLKTLEKKINNYPKYSFSKRPLRLVISSTYDLWKDFDSLSTTANVIFIQSSLSMKDFSKLSVKLQLKCSVFRYDTFDYYSFLQEITTRRTLLNKILNVSKSLLLSVPQISFILSVPIMFLRFLLFSFKKLICFKPKNNQDATNKLVQSLTDTLQFEDLNPQEISEKLSNIFNQVIKG